jgi:small subunit ribosomal protein S16
MLRIRLQRRGKSKHAAYRVVVAEKGAPIKGRFIADLGSYNPHTSVMVVDAKAVKEWMSQGVQPSDTVNNLLIENKVIAGEKVKVWSPKKKASDKAA